MRNISKSEFLSLIEKRSTNSAENKLDLRGITLEKMDLSNCCLKNIDFSNASFVQVCLRNVDFSNCQLNNAWFENDSFEGTKFVQADLTACMLRNADLRGCDLRGANLFCAVLEHARLEECISDENTKFFRLFCPETGAFVGYKKCCDDRIVELLIPADAKRTSATRNSCRCNRAKVLIIKSPDCSTYFEEAWSLVNESFMYRKGSWVEVPDFDEDRWNDSTTGIHFWLSREEALLY